MGSYSYSHPVMVAYRARRDACLTLLRRHGQLDMGDWRKQVSELAMQFNCSCDTMWIAATSLVSDHTVQYNFSANTVSA